jgi:hypothetical protein
MAAFFGLNDPATLNVTNHVLDDTHRQAYQPSLTTSNLA